MSASPATDPPVWVALLRGLNVGASHRVTMVDLRAAVVAAGGLDVTTHIQSGNVLLRHATADRATLTRALEDGLGAALGFPVPVVLRTGTELAELVARCPFTEQDRLPDRRRYVTFLAVPPAAERVDTLVARATDGESLYVTEAEVCAAVPYDLSRPVYADVERILKVPCTSRAWNVVEKLADLAAPKE